MKVLVFDTETTGLPKGRNPSIKETDAWPYIVQLSFIIYDTTTSQVIKCYDNIIKLPDDVEISDKSVTLHGISKDISQTKGIGITTALSDFNKYLSECDMVVGHNISFDKRMIMVESIRKKVSQYFTVQGVRKPEFCTMKNSIDLCKIERVSKTGEKYYKYPSLEELHNHLFNYSPNTLHNSLVDVIITLRCYLYMEYRYDVLAIDTGIPHNLIKKFSILSY